MEQQGWPDWLRMIPVPVSLAFPPLVLLSLRPNDRHATLVVAILLALMCAYQMISLPLFTALAAAFDIKVQRETDYFLGTNVEDHSPSEMTLSAKTYIRSMVKKYLPTTDSFPTARTCAA